MVSIVLLSGVCRRLSSSVTLHGGAYAMYHQGAARDGGPVVLRPVKGRHLVIIAT